MAALSDADALMAAFTENDAAAVRRALASGRTAGRDLTKINVTHISAALANGAVDALRVILVPYDKRFKKMIVTQMLVTPDGAAGTAVRRLVFDLGYTSLFTAIVFAASKNDIDFYSYLRELDWSQLAENQDAYIFSKDHILWYACSRASLFIFYDLMERLQPISIELLDRLLASNPPLDRRELLIDMGASAKRHSSDDYNLKLRNGVKYLRENILY